MLKIDTGAVSLACQYFRFGHNLVNWRIPVIFLERTVPGEPLSIDRTCRVNAAQLDPDPVYGPDIKDKDMSSPSVGRRGCFASLAAVDNFDRMLFRYGIVSFRAFSV